MQPVHTLVKITGNNTTALTASTKIATTSGGSDLRVSDTISYRFPYCVMAGLVPAIHVLGRCHQTASMRLEYTDRQRLFDLMANAACVDRRDKPGHDDRE